MRFSIVLLVAVGAALLIPMICFSAFRGVPAWRYATKVLLVADVFVGIMIAAGVSYHRDIAPAFAVNLDQVDRVGPDGVSCAKMPDLAGAALQASEDRRFEKRKLPIDSRAIARALAARLRFKREGGSTLEMQAARMILGRYERTFGRKVSEAILATRLRLHWSKPAIIEYYLNHATFAGGQIGLRAASWRWFGREPRELKPSEIYGLIYSLRRPSNFGSDENLRTAARNYLRDAAAENIVSEGRHDEAIAEMRFHRGRIPAGPFLVGAGPDAGGGNGWQSYSRSIRADALRLLPPEIRKRVETEHTAVNLTLDPSLQSELERLAIRHLERLEARHPGTKLETAIMVIDASTGEIRAMVSSRDPGRDYSFNTQAHRPCSSTEKPLLLAAALDTGRFTLRTMMRDEPVRGNWPANFGGEHFGSLSLRKALANSVNTIFAKLIADPAVADALEKLHTGLGMPAFKPGDLSVALGSNEVTNLQLASAYSTIARRGVYFPPILVREVRDASGAVIYQPTLQSQRVMQESSASSVMEAMRAVVTEGTGKNLRLQGAAKTGTSSAEGGIARDLRFAYVLPAKFAATVWIGSETGGLWDASAGKDLAPFARAIFLACEEAGRERDSAHDERRSPE